MSLEIWKSLFEIVGVVLLFLSFLSGAGVLFTSSRINANQAERLRKFDQDLTTAKTELGKQQERVALADKLAGEANERAAKLEIEAVSLRMGLIKQGPRAILLSGERRQLFIKELEPFAGQKVEVRFRLYSLSSGNSVLTDEDTRTLALGLQVVLKRAGWNVSPAMFGDSGGKSILIEVRPGASLATLKAADALIAALRHVPLETFGNKPVISAKPRPPQGHIFGENHIQLQMPTLDANTIVIEVLDHP